MEVTLFANEATWVWFGFAADIVTMIGFVVTIIGFLLTWRRQATIRRETSAAVARIALMVLNEALQQLSWQVRMAEESCRSQGWARARDFCVSARETALLMVGNPHLTTVEKDGLRAHADNLAQVKNYLEANKLGEDPPAHIQPAKKEALDQCTTFILSIRTRLNQIVLES